MKKIFWIVLLTCCSFSCDDEVISNIPLAQVYIKLDLNFEDRDLIGAFSYKSFLPGSERYAQEHYGYGGIVVFNALDKMAAFDLSCPVEAQSNIRVTPNSSGQAICSKCGAVFNLNSEGFPSSGSDYALRQYRVTRTGTNMYQVTH